MKAKKLFSILVLIIFIISILATVLLFKVLPP